MAYSTLQELQKSFDEPQKKSGNDRLQTMPTTAAAELSTTDTVMGMLMRGKSLSDGLVALLYELANEPLTVSYAAGGRKNPIWRQWVMSLRDIIESVQPELLLDSSANRRKVQRKGRDALHRLAGMPRVKKATLQEIGKRMVEIIRETDRDAIDSKRWELPMAEVGQTFLDVNEEQQDEVEESAASLADMVIYDMRVPDISAANEVLNQDQACGDVQAMPEPKPAHDVQESDADFIVPEPDAGLEEVLSQTLRPGAWFKLYSAGSLGLRWLKLANYDSATRLVQFENRDGQIIHEQDAVSLVSDLVMGKVELVHDENEFEANLDTVISGCRKTHKDDGSATRKPH